MSLTENSKADLLLSKLKEAVRAIDADSRVYLFGSRARGDSHSDSDWDFLVVSSKENKRDFEDELLYPVYDLMLEYDELIQIIVFEKEKWENGASPSPIYDTIRNEGVEL